MAQEKEAPNVTVHQVGLDDEGQWTAVVTWNPVPEMVFELVMGSAGDLRAVTARAVDQGQLAARRLRLAPVGEMQRAVRAFVEKNVLPARRVEVPDELRPSIEAQLKAADLIGEAALAAEVEALGLGTAEQAMGGLWWMKHVERSARALAGSRSGRPDRYYAVIAARYVALLTEKNPVERLAAELDVKTKTANNYLSEARYRGLLTKPGRGRAGGVLTDKAKEILYGDR